MIGDFLFFIKMVFLTLFLVLALQVKIGEQTVEQHTLHWAASAPLLEPLKEVAHGGVLALGRGWQAVVTSLGGKVSHFFNKENIPGHRTLGVKLERSQKFIKEQTLKAQNAMEDYGGVVESVEPKAVSQEPIYVEDLGENVGE